MVCAEELPWRQAVQGVAWIRGSFGYGWGIWTEQAEACAVGGRGDLEVDQYRGGGSGTAAAFGKIAAAACPVEPSGVRNVNLGRRAPRSEEREKKAA